MTHSTLSPTLPQPPSLEALLDRGPVALFLDFDGTLIEIAPGPDAIDVPASLARRLERLAVRLDGRLALVSGRGLDNIARHVGPMAVAQAGSHGAHRITSNGTMLGDNPQPLCPDTLGQLEELAQTHDALLERKAHGAALHYRAKRAAGAAIEEGARQIAEANGLVAKSGKCVIELVRPGAEKGGAVRAFMGLPPFSGSTPVFLGDDVTDEDGFIAARALGGFGIAVGERASDNATCSLPQVKDVHAWLKL